MTSIAPRSPVSRIWEGALDLLFPPRCVTCAKFGAFICSACREAMIPADGRRCESCWMPMPREGAAATCRRCRYRPPAFNAARSAFAYEGAARDAVHSLKFGGLSAVAPLMAAEMASVLAEWAPPVDAIVPVPLAGHRRRLRGYDQAYLIARELSRLSSIPLARHALVRRRSTPPQARGTNEFERRRNVIGAFTAGKHVPTGAVLLVDDVLTTGATLDACARVLGTAASPVFALTFARED